MFKHSTRLTRYFRSARLAVHLLVGVCATAFIFPLIRLNTQKKWVRWWSRRALAIFNFRVVVQGSLSSNAQFLVGNHVSWLDIFALNSQFAISFVAKSEIKQWPFFGFLAQKGHTLFVQRDKRSNAKLQLAQILTQQQQGHVMGIFPEGTTTDGTTLAPFKSSLLQAAIDAQAQIQPVAICYPLANGAPDIGLAYAGETTLLQSIQQLLLRQNPTVMLHFLPALDLKQHPEIKRQTLAKLLQDQIQAALF